MTLSLVLHELGPLTPREPPVLVPFAQVGEAPQLFAGCTVRLSRRRLPRSISELLRGGPPGFVSAAQVDSGDVDLEEVRAVSLKAAEADEGGISVC